MIQLILHLWGDYILQSDWMAQNKTKRWWPSIVHATLYSLPFFLIGGWRTVLVIWSTHAIIDRFRLARFLCWFKNFLAPNWIPCDPDCDACRVSGPIQRNYPWVECSKTGYPSSTPDWLAVWLMIICDNTLHLTINYLCLRYL